MPYGIYLKLDQSRWANGDFSSESKLSGQIFTDPSLIAETGETFLDNFRQYTSQVVADTAWPSTDVAQHRVNMIDDNLGIDIIYNSSNDAIGADIGSVINNSAWVLRFKLRFSQLTSSTNASFWIGLSDSVASSAASVSQDFIGIHIVNKTATKEYGGVSVNNSNLPTTSDVAQTYTFLVSTDYYVEIIRTSSTTYTVEVFTDSDFITGSLGKLNGTTAANVNNLQYLVIKNNDAISESGQFTGNIDNISFWDGVVVPPIDDRAKDLTGYDIKVKMFKYWGSTDFFNKVAQPNIPRRGTWVYQVQEGDMPSSGIYVVEVELTKAGVKESTLNIQELLVRSGE
jgi:hypothetical protein